MINKIIFMTAIAIFFSPITNSSNVDELILPNGFEIEIVASDLNTPRQMVETNNGYIIVGSKKGNKIVALVDYNNDGFYEKTITLADKLQNPTGVTFYQSDLYFAEIDTVWVIRDIDKWIESKSNKLPKKEIFFNDLPSETWHDLNILILDLTEIFIYQLEYRVIFVLNHKHKIKDLQQFIK